MDNELKVGQKVWVAETQVVLVRCRSCGANLKIRPLVRGGFRICRFRTNGVVVSDVKGKFLTFLEYDKLCLSRSMAVQKAKTMAAERTKEDMKRFGENVLRKR